MKVSRILRYYVAVIIIAISFIIVFPQGVIGETIIYDTINSQYYKSITIDEVTNINYIDSYNYKVYLNDTYLGEYKKGEQILVPDNSDIKIVVPSNVKQSLSANNFIAVLSTGFYSFMQYWIYIIIIIIGVFWFTSRRK